MAETKYVDPSVVANFAEITIDDLILEMAKHRRSIKMAYASYVEFIDLLAKKTNIPADKRSDAIAIAEKMLPGMWSKVGILNGKINIITNQFTSDLQALQAAKLHPLTWKRLQYLITGDNAFESYLDVANPQDMRKTSMGMSGFNDFGIVLTTAAIIVISICGALAVTAASAGVVLSYREYRKMHEADLKFSIEARQQIVAALEDTKDRQIALIDQMNISKEEKDKMKLDAEKEYAKDLSEVPARIDPPKTPGPFDGLDLGKIGTYLLIATGVAAGGYVAGQAIGLIGKKKQQ